MKIMEIVRGWRWPLVALAGLGILFGLFAQTLPTFEFLKKITTLEVVVGFFSSIAVLAGVGLFFRRANRDKAKSKRPASVNPSTPGATRKTKLDWAPWASVIASFILLLILIAFFFPALWEWLWGQGKVFGLLVITILVVALATKYKPIWWLVVIMGTVLLFSWTSFPPNPLDWRLPTIETARRVATERQANNTPQSPAGRSTATDHWELCWTKHPNNVGINPAIREYCVAVNRMNMDGPILTMDTVSKEGLASSFVWDQKEPKGVWYNDLGRTKPAGVWGLQKISPTQWAGYVTTLNGEQGTMILQQQ